MLNFIDRFVLFVLLACLGATAGCNQALPPQGEWVTFSSSDGKVTAKFPREPKETSQTVNSEIGPLTVKMNSVETRTSAFMVNHMTYPVSPSEFDAAAGLEGAVQGAASNIGGTIVETTDIEQSGFGGKEVLISAKDNVHVKARIYIDPGGPTLFQGLVVGNQELVNGPDAAFFLDSFTVK